MNKHRPGDSPLTPAEQLANVYDALAEDLSDASSETDAASRERAVRIFNSARDRALSPKTHPESTRPSAKPSKAPAKSPETSPSKRRGLAWWRYWLGLHSGVAFVLVAVAFFLTLVDIYTSYEEWEILMAIGLFADICGFYVQVREYKDNFWPFILKLVIASAMLAVPTPVSPIFFLAAGLLGYKRTQELGLFTDKSKRAATSTKPDAPVETAKQSPNPPEAPHPPLDESSDDPRIPPHIM